MLCFLPTPTQIQTTRPNVTTAQMAKEQTRAASNAITEKCLVFLSCEHLLRAELNIWSVCVTRVREFSLYMCTVGSTHNHSPTEQQTTQTIITKAKSAHEQLESTWKPMFPLILLFYSHRGICECFVCATWVQGPRRAKRKPQLHRTIITYPRAHFPIVPPGRTLLSWMTRCVPCRPNILRVYFCSHLPLFVVQMY